MTEFYNLKQNGKYEFAGSKTLGKGEDLTLFIGRREGTVYVKGDGSDSYKTLDTVMDKTTIILQDSDSVDGWLTIGGADYQSDAEKVCTWGGVKNAFKIIANPANVGSINVYWNFRG